MSDLSKMRDDGLYEVIEYKINKKGERIKECFRAESQANFE